MEKGIAVHKLLDSEIFRYKIDFEEWPETHTNRTYCLRPFNTNIFELRHQYTAIFEDIGYHNPNEKHEDADGGHYHQTTKKLFKVEFTVNLLPNVSFYYELVNGVKIKKNPNDSLMFLCS